MAIGFVGDIHGMLKILKKIVDETIPYDDVKCIIQVGDFGVSPKKIEELKKEGLTFPKPTYVIDGNHEYFDYLMEMKEVTEILPNLFYVPRGTVLELDGKIVAFLGGAASIDKKWQVAEGNWDYRENISPEEILKLHENVEKIGKSVDIFVTHVPPFSAIKTYFPDADKLWFGVPLTWEDPNSIAVQKIWESWNFPTLVCGHMHKNIMFDASKKSQILAECSFTTI